MPKPVVLDIETQLTFREVGKYNPKKLKISVAGLYDYATDKFLAFEEHELPQMFPFLENASMIIGFNVIDFDLAVVAPYYVGDLSILPTLDLLKHVEQSIGHRVSLDQLARETLGTQKTGHGLQAIEFFRNNEIDKLKQYCLSDVKITRDLYEFGRKEGKVYFKDVNTRKEIAVNWEESIDGNKSEINLTMPW